MKHPQAFSKKQQLDEIEDKGSPPKPKSFVIE